MRTSHGLRMTQVASRCHAPWPNGLGCRMGIRMLLIRFPSIASIAGSSVTPYSTEIGHDDCARDPHRHERGAGVEEQPGEADRHGQTAEEDRASGSRHRGRERVLDAVPRSQFLAEARDDEQ